MLNLGGVLLGRVPADELERLWLAAREAEPTYDHVGSTFEGTRAAARSRRRDLGQGRAAFETARAGLRRWSAHAALGARILPHAAAVERGATVLVVLRAGPATVVAPTRIVRVVDEADAFGFAYGTLPGHPERGEESFVVEHEPGGTVQATITVDAVPATRAARAAAPVVRVLQELAVRRYLAGIARAARRPSAAGSSGPGS